MRRLFEHLFSHHFPLYRPTLHQLLFYDWSETGQDVALDIVGQALTHLEPMIAELNAQPLRQRLEEMRQTPFPRERRYPLIRYTLQPAANDPTLRVGFLALQENTDLLLHFIWYKDSREKKKVFNELESKLWQIPASHHELASYWGQSLLLAAVLEGPTLEPEAKNTFSKQLVRPLINPELNLTPISLNLNGPATLYLPAQAFLNDQSPKGAVLLYDSRAAEESKQANRFVLSEWPFLALYQSQIEQLYQRTYQQQIYPTLQADNQNLSEALEKSFTSHTKRRWFPFLRSNNPENVQQTLRKLSNPQYHHLEHLSQAQKCAHDVQRGLNNLRRVIDNASNLKYRDNDIDPTSIREQLTRQAQQYYEQIESDITSAQLLEERTNRAITILQTEADILGAGYDRTLNFIIGIAGTALAVGQLVNNETAALLYQGLAYLVSTQGVWESIGVPILTEENKTFILVGVRFLTTGISVLIAWLVISIYLRLARK